MLPLYKGTFFKKIRGRVEFHPSYVLLAITSLIQKTNVMKTYTIARNFILCFLFLTTGLLAQNGEISGIVKDENGEGMPGANVFLYSGDQQIRNTVTGADGKYLFKPLDAGSYTVRVTFISYDTMQVTLTVAGGKTRYQDIKMVVAANQLPVVRIVPPYENMVQETMSTGKKIDYMEIKLMPVNKGDIVNLAANLTPGLMPTANGKDVYIRGARAGTTAYFIDGQRVIGSYGVASHAIQGMTVYTGGIPAMYGDVTGGIIDISTKSYFSGMAQKKAMYADYLDRNQKKEQEVTE